MKNYLAQLEKNVRELPHDVMETGHKVWLAGMGAVGMVGHTTTTLFDSLVEEGKRFQKAELKMVDSAVAATTGTVSDVWKGATTLVQDNVQSVTKAAMNRLGMPSRADVAALTARVEALTAKVEAIAKKGHAHVG